MKDFRKVCFALMAALCFSITIQAQDIITLKTGEEIKAKVLEVNINEVKYKKADNVQGPTYTVEKAMIFMIKYEDGSKDIFNTTQAQPQTNQAQPQTNQYGNKQPYGQQQYGNQSVQQPNPNYRPKSPGLAWFFSFLVPGVGQFYNGSVGKGVTFVVMDGVGYFMMVGGASSGDEDGATMALVGAGIYLTSWIWAQIDAPLTAKKKNRANGYGLIFDIGKGDSYLALEPDFRLEPVGVSQKATMTPTYGVGIKLKF